MSKSNFPDRADRLEKILVKTERWVRLPLFHEAFIPKNLFSAFQEDCVNYLLASLRAADQDKSYSYQQDFLETYKQDLLDLPNMTPNGLILPKKDNFLEYNRFHQSVCKIFKSFGIDEHVKKIHVPVNVRLINGSRTENDSRPRASSKLHSDVWAGEFTDTIMLFLTAMGDLENNGIEFYEPPRRFYTEFCKPLNDYLEGASLEAESERYDCALRQGYGYFTDPFLLHRTIKKSSKLRLSIDFRFIPRENCETDAEVRTERHKNYVPLEEWYSVGDTKVLYTDVTVAESRAENLGPKNAYAADYQLRSF